MAFQMGNPSPLGGSMGAVSNAQTQTGPDLEEIQTEALGFQAIAGESKLRLLPSPWPADSLPPPTASLLSIASKKALLAAAGPESVVIAGTDSVRQAFSASADGNIKPYTPQLTIPIGMRVSQVAFSADEDFLVLSAETGGGLAVYEVQALIQGNTQSTFQLPTNGAALRALVPNPTPETAELFAVVTTNGELLMANLKTRQFLNGSQGQVLKDGVSYVSWSTQGKQLVVGLGNGTLCQMTPKGEMKGEIPRPPALEGDQHVSSILWLENNVFLVAHTPSSFEAGQALATTYHVVTHQASKASAMMFQKLPEPCLPFEMSRLPHFQFMRRLKNFPPNISDAIVVASTASVDIGLVTRSKTPLSSDVSAEVSNVFTTTIMADDSRRAQLPMSEDMGDTSPIGVGFDLSSKDKVLRPLPKEEYDASPGPLPALMILNNEGILASWWIVYAESIRQGTSFPGLVAVGGTQTQQQPQAERQASSFANARAQTAPPFGQTTFGKPETKKPGSMFEGPLSQLANNALASPGPAFGATSTIGKPSSPWADGATICASTQSGSPAFSRPSFGSTTPMGATTQGTAFGTAGVIGARQSPWGKPSSSTPVATDSVSGQPSLGGGNISPFVGATTGNSFGSNTATSSQAPTSSGFASFASKPSGFLTTITSSNAESPFGKVTSGAFFDYGMEADT
ncbi:hypothetical protein ABVK25_000144 [Lepraria finkii]|uniref:Nucleoporin Nup159/Nup146 N-terminal domain-containing protein n=1 Tax=Lepraria finkii TaxID=1340010 RepID=A0ABR4BM23_9LECA